jgi:hypothetical protein
MPVSSSHQEHKKSSPQPIRSCHSPWRRHTFMIFWISYLTPGLSWELWKPDCPIQELDQHCPRSEPINRPAKQLIACLGGPRDGSHLWRSEAHFNPLFFNFLGIHCSFLQEHHLYKHFSQEPREWPTFPRKVVWAQTYPKFGDWRGGASSDWTQHNQ